MTSSHYDHYTGGNHYQPPNHNDSFEDHRCPTVDSKHGPGAGSYGAVPGPTVVVQYGSSQRGIHDKGFVAFGAFLLVVSVVLFICGTLAVTGVIRWSFDQTCWKVVLFSFGGVILLAGLCFFIPSAQHEVNKRNNEQQQVTERDLLIGPGQPRFSPPSQPYYQQSHQPSSQSYYQPSHHQPSSQPYYQPSHQPSHQQGSGISPQPFQEISTSTNPPPYDSATTGPYPNAGSSTFPDPELGHMDAN